MSPAVVEAVAWLALAGVVGFGTVLVVLARRLEALTRAHTDRKWEIAVLRSEVGDLRRRLDTRTPSHVPEQGAPDVDDERAARAWPASPTAWRRERGRPPARPRRRRPG